ncbi:hypothetical protein T265_12532 [Opisthorchis viverrini]|uniref:S-adenosyl-methyltransferase MraW n=1 Tax=Opisthorchis viverrini TaxID=6198 RepID=A0A075ACQ7_OPIVI|nr:hypothetical protein T265_12532 [Opisthorchis viverrini]KER33740.1 hypothetical protein T265_12532 [Opisthorchis viverrini]
MFNRILSEVHSAVVFFPRTLMFSGKRFNHIPVMEREIVDFLSPKPNEVLLDMTFGAGGHTRALLETTPSLKCYCLDRDQEFLSHFEQLKNTLGSTTQTFVALLGKFSDLPRLCQQHGLGAGTVDMIVMDLGVSSMQLDNPERGFAFKTECSLDMRMDGPAQSNQHEFTDNQSVVTPFRCLAAMPREGSTRAGMLPGCPSLDRGSREAEVGPEPQTFRSVNSRSTHPSHLAPVRIYRPSTVHIFHLKEIGLLSLTNTTVSNGSTPTAADVLNNLSAADLAQIFRLYGEERYSRRIANAITDHRHTLGPIRTTKQLADIVCSVVPSRSTNAQPGSSTHPATRVFQALRIFVNDELNELCVGLELAEKLLKPATPCPGGRAGRLAVISFHSLEDRIVKWAFSVPTTKTDVGLAVALANRTTASMTGIHRRQALLRQLDPAASESLSVRSPRWAYTTELSMPTEEEISRNQRARSAKLRGAVKA